MTDTRLTTFRRNIRTAVGKIDGVIASVDEGCDGETKYLLRTLQRSIARISDDAKAAIDDQCELLRKRCRVAQSQLANERYKNSKHPTIELVDHAIMHAQDMAALVNMDEYGNEVRATLGLLKILRDESNGISPPGCGYNGNDPVGLEEG